MEDAQVKNCLQQGKMQRVGKASLPNHASINAFAGANFSLVLNVAFAGARSGE